MREKEREKKEATKKRIDPQKSSGYYRAPAPATKGLYRGNRRTSGEGNEGCMGECLSEVRVQPASLVTRSVKDGKEGWV